MGAELFFHTLFHDKPRKDYILIWEKRKDKKLSFWFDHTSDAIQHFKTQGNRQDTYIGCGTSTKALTVFRRCKADEVSGIPAAWIDVDILDPVHSKPNLPENEKLAREVIEPFPLKPTIIVHSGHGYQFWWVFDKFLKFNDAQQHEDAANLLHQFTWTMRDHARAMGYDLDMTFDLSRVFRIPGGKNFKDDPPSPVVMEACGENYYTLNEFKDALKQCRVALGNNATPIEPRKRISLVNNAVQGELFTLDPNAEPPKDKFDVIMTVEPKFAASWEHRRRDFKSGDESASAYDLSLASFAYGAQWEPQEIVNLLIAFRRTNGLAPKLVESYYRRTLKAASNALENRKTMDELVAIVEDKILVEDNPQKTLDENTVARNVAVDVAKKALLQYLKVHVIRVVKYKLDSPEYRLETEEGCIHLGPVQNLIDQPLLRRKIVDAVGLCISRVKSTDWDYIVNALLALTEEESAGDDTSNKGQVRYWLHHYLTRRNPLYDLTEGMLAHRPFYYQNCLYLCGPEFREHIASFLHEIISNKAMGMMLKEYGFEPLTQMVKKDGKWVSRSAWKIDIAKDQVAQEFIDWDLLTHANQVAAEAQILKEAEREAI